MRKIQVKGNQTFEKLHAGIQNAFEFDDDHLYHFEVGGRKPDSKSATRYMQPMAMEETRHFDTYTFGIFNAPVRKEYNLKKTKVSSLDLKKGQAFFYNFDYGDDWWFRIKVSEIYNEIPKGRYPKVVDGVGENPPQYINWDEEEWAD